MRWLALAVVSVWLALAAPLFTDGGCTAEFEGEARRIELERSQMATLAAARQYWVSRAVPYRVLSLEQCRRARMAFIEQCGPGAMVHASVPVSSLVCRIYRDDAITVQLHFTEKERLARVQVDMKPYRSLPIPGGPTIHWAR